MSTNVTTFDYISNFLYENGELKMIYHPEGDEALRIAPGEQFSFGPGCRAAKPTPPSAENDTEFVFDYFIKDYLGNVRVVMTEEDATYTDKFLATLEDVHAYIEEVNFENLEEVREDLPTGYPVNGSVSLNERIALLNAANGTEIGPSIVLPVKQGEKVSLSTEYFYTEDAAGATYDNIDFLINEVLIAFAAGGSGILPLNETQLIDIASGQGNYSNALANLFNNEIDTTDMSRPYAYMVWTAYDANLNIIPGASGIERVSDPNDLEVLIREEIAITADGFLHAYVSNGSAVGVNFDNFQVTTMRGKVRQINHYYPYGLTISGIGTNSDEYLNKYTTKELQTGEWNPAASNGLEMYDFHARHYDPQLGRWFAPDPAEQFSNPYLAMGNNPVMYVDPDGEWVFIAAGFLVGAYIGGAMANDHMNPGKWDFQDANTWIGMGVGGAIGAFGGHALGAAKGKAAFFGMNKGSAAAKAAGKKFFGSTVGGTTNTITNYDGADSFGWGTLADFGAGFGGSYVGLSTNSWAAGFNSGGFLNATSNLIQDGFEGPIQFAQDWIGGGLSSTLGMKYGKLTSTFTPFGTETKFAKAGNAFVKNGLAANAWDFAYSDWDKYRKKSWGDHLALFAVAGATASITDAVMKPSKGVNFESMDAWQKVGEYTGRGMWGMAGSMMGYNLVGLVKSRQFYYSSGSQQNKAEQMSLKWWLNLIKP
jgi:RHS repeat-associated protein